METFLLTNYNEFSVKAKFYASHFNPCIILDSCDIEPALNLGKYKLIVAWGGSQLRLNDHNLFSSLHDHWEKKPSWIFGVLGYNLKNKIEKLASNNDACFDWPDHSFFKPEIVIAIDWQDNVSIEGEEPRQIYEAIMHSPDYGVGGNKIHFESQPRFDFDTKSHEAAVEKIKESISKGDYYELNLCARFLYENCKIQEPYGLYTELTALSPAPFSAFFKSDFKHILCTSPERYLSKFKNRLYSQPIKGTRPRLSNKQEDLLTLNELRNNEKDRAENVMIVDLVRNDLSKVANTGTVKVEELFGIYSYSHVHQMVSTISCEFKHELPWIKAFESSFPMGSMTGAPKIAAMQNIENLEQSNREWYSGALGYVSPNGDFDFNVLIRSLFYDAQLSKMAFYAGGAITIDSKPEEEYNEMMVKADAILQMLNRYI